MDATPLMVEVKNQETYEKESGIWIDSASVCETLVAIGLFIALLVLTIYACLATHDPINTRRVQRPFSGNATETFHFSAAPLSPYSRFVEYGFSLLRRSSECPPHPISIPYSIYTAGRSQMDLRPKRRVRDLAVKFEGRSNNSLLIPLFRESIILSEIESVRLTFEHPHFETYGGFLFFISSGGHDQTTFESYFRFIYAAFQIVSLWLLRNQSRNPFCAWPLGHKLTIPLLIIGPVANNPFYFVHCYYPHCLFLMVEAISNPLYHSVVYFDVLLILNLVINKSSRLLIVPQIVLAVALFSSEFALNCHRLNESFVGPSFQISAFVASFAKCEFLVNLVFSIWVLALMVRAAQTIDLTDGLKTYTYLVACSVVLFMSIGSGWSPARTVSWTCKSSGGSSSSDAATCFRRFWPTCTGHTTSSSATGMG
jgi:hypothetical protein